jgi:nucleotide-binding universal stress UspA family protein
MSESRAHLVTTSEALTARGAAARAQRGERLVLIPVDFSQHSQAALTHACELAAAVPAALIALHVVHDPGEMPGYYSKLIQKKGAGRIQDDASAAFNEFMDRAIDSRPDLTLLGEVEQVMVIGLPVTRILEVVKELDPWLVVMGSQGRTGLRHMMMGSKASQIVQLCPVPVTVVKGKKEKKRKDKDKS